MAVRERSAKTLWTSAMRLRHVRPGGRGSCARAYRLHVVVEWLRGVFVKFGQSPVEKF